MLLNISLQAPWLLGRPFSLRAEEEPELIDEDADPAGDGMDQIEESLPTDELEALVTQAGLWWGILVGIVVSFLVALVITLVTSTVMKQIFRKSPEVRRAVNRTRIPLLVTITLVGTRLSVGFVARDEFWFPLVAFSLVVAIVIGIAWWALRLVHVVEAFILAKYTGEGDLEDRRGRRLQTQVSLIRRILAAVIITLAVAAVLLSIEEVRALGVGMLASAGVVSVVAGLAMQTTLTNLFAGIQLAFTDSIRVGDVVVVEENFGSVEDITLSTVVLKSWDGRRFVYPSSYFVGTPFENWTRVGTEMMGSVDLEVDWRVPVDALRSRLSRLVETTDLWDGQEASIQVTEALGGTVQARAVVSARNSGELWDLQCLIREDFVNFLRVEHPYAVVTQRMLVSHEEALGSRPEPIRTGQVGTVDAEAAEGSESGAAAGTLPPDAAEAGATATPEEQDFLDRYGSVTDPSAGTDSTPLATAGEGASIFTGSISAVERNREFSGPGEEAYRERRERQEENDGAEIRDPKDTGQVEEQEPRGI